MKALRRLTRRPGVVSTSHDVVERRGLQWAADADGLWLAPRDGSGPRYMAWNWRLPLPAVGTVERELLAHAPWPAIRETAAAPDSAALVLRELGVGS